MFMSTQNYKILGPIQVSLTSPSYDVKRDRIVNFYYH